MSANEPKRTFGRSDRANCCLVIIHVSVLHEPLYALLPKETIWGTFGQSKRYPPARTPPEQFKTDK